MKNKNRSRRQFLRNVSIASLSLGVSNKLGASQNSSRISSSGDCSMTTQDYYGQGPFYTENPPMIGGNKLASNDEPGERIIITGQVRTLDCLKIIPDTIIDVWHADDAGAYDNSGYNLRGYTKSNAQGFYLFETILPGKYLNGALHRPRHIHFKITPPSSPTLTTQLYFEGDTSIPADAAASITSGPFDATPRIINLTPNGDDVLEGTWDIIIDGDGISSSSNIHLDKGMIYDVSPNPFKEHLDIRYGVFKKSNVSILVFNMNGELVSSLEDRELSPEKYTAQWTPEADTPPGYYFIILQLNAIQVHYSKVLFGK